MPTGIGTETGWWCPSLDDVGNGTTTLRDLIGENHCTLGSSGSWVNNTASGGVRAIAGGNINTFASTWLLSGTFGISLWAYGIGSFPGAGLSDGSLGWILYPFNGTNNGVVLYGAVSFSETATANTRAGWHHIFLSQISGTGQKVYVDGALVGTASQMTLGNTSVKLMYYTYGSNNYFSGRMDDLRFFSGVSVPESSIVNLATRRGYQPQSALKPQHPLSQQVIG
jgi:hypothetical protein